MTSLTDFHVHPLTDPRPFPVSYLRDNQVYPILVSGIVNPSGPTLFVVAAVRDRTSAPLALVYSYLNPFQSGVFIPGYLTEGQLGTPLPDQILQALQPFQLFEGGIPSLCLVDSFLDELDVRYLYRHLFANAGNLRGPYERLKRFPLNPWDRVKEEMDEVFGTKTAQPSNNSEPLSEAELDALLDIVLDPRHNNAELPAFGYAWKEAIDEQRKVGNIEAADQAFQHEGFVALLAHLLESVEYEFE